MVQRTQLPHTFENQAVLREYGEKIAQGFKNRSPIQPKSWWGWIKERLPTSQTTGFVIGQQVGALYGASWSNAAIDLVVKQFFPTEPQQESSWWGGIKDSVWGGTQATLAETLKLTFTPKIVPYTSLLAGTAGSFALPALISLVSSVYQRVMFNPRALQQLAQVPLDQLLTIDEPTGRWRDAFGRLLAADDMRDILRGVMKNELLRKLIDICHAVDQLSLGDDQLQQELQIRFNTLVKTDYFIERTDGKVTFLDGTLVTPEDQKVIQEGIALLSRINSRHKKKQIHQLVKLLARHAFLPVETFSVADKNQLTVDPKRMPAIFSGKDEWKNSIILTADGKYVISQDSGSKKKGTILQTEMNTIFDEMKDIQQKSEGKPLKGRQVVVQEAKMIKPQRSCGLFRFFRSLFGLGRSVDHPSDVIVNLKK